MRPGCRKAFRVLTVSEYSRQRIVTWAGIDPDRVINVGNGVDERYCVDVTPYQPGFPYLLNVGNRKAHKNEVRVLEAFARANIDPAIHLIFTGHANDALLALSRRLGVEDRVVFAGRVAEAELPQLYRGALMLVFPSLYEGFGLPVIEAMACGAPVLTANTTSLPEVAGNAALLVDPLSVEQIAAGVERLCVDDVLRDALRQKGLKRAAQFSWDDVAAKVKAVLDELEQEMAT
jgi:glycosyltransferase involved in cell wall biosynthesis